MDWHFDQAISIPHTDAVSVLDTKIHNTFITETSSHEYEVSVSRLPLQKRLLLSTTENHDNAECCGSARLWLREQSIYGGDGTALLDFQGINSFLYGRARFFSDATARAVARHFVRFDGTFLRVGAAGSAPRASHPGGEVIEYSCLDGRSFGGLSASRSGWVPEGKNWGVSARLAVEHLHVESRSVYSHTALLPLRKTADEITPRNDDIWCEDVLDHIHAVARKRRISAYAIRLHVCAHAADEVIVSGRVMMQTPRNPLKTVDEATAAAIESTFPLSPGQALESFGTYRRREEPEWEAFRGGKQYEPRGHLHAVVSKPRERQHAVFHLRGLKVLRGAHWQAIIDPATVYIDAKPVEQFGGFYVDSTSGRTRHRVGELLNG